MVIDKEATVNFVLSWGSIAGIAGWIAYEIRQAWKKMADKIDLKLDEKKCREWREEEKEARIREREAAKEARERWREDHHADH
jgi:hypothetical protein